MFKSRSKNGSLLFHSSSSATLPLKQSTACVGEAYSTSPTTIRVSNFSSRHPRAENAALIPCEIGDSPPPAVKISDRSSRNPRSTARISAHSSGQAVINTPAAFRHSLT